LPDDNLQTSFTASYEPFFQKAADSPEAYDIRDRDLRRVNLEKFTYHFMFRIVDDTVRILVVRHHRRRPSLGLHRR
jgi:hypothetical protein